MINAISWIVIIILSIISIIFAIREYKKTKNVVEKVLYLLLLMIYFVPVIIYYLDRFDLPTRFGYANNINTDRWFDFFSSYITSIIATIISGIILVLITLKQISIQIENNNDDKRIQNAPIFDYILSNNLVVNCKCNHRIVLKENGAIHHVFLGLENIGLSHSRNIKFLIKVDNESDKKFSLNDYQSFIKKDEHVWIDLVFNFDENNRKPRNIVIEVYYDDLIGNRYMQKIKANFIISDNAANSRKIDITDFLIEKELLLEDDGDMLC